MNWIRKVTRMTDGHIVPTRILVEVHTSRPFLDKSSDQRFTITLSARVDHHRPVTINAFMTVLYSQGLALDSQGLVFKDTATGTYAERRQFYVQWQLPDRLTATTDSIVQLPPRDAADAYTVSHTFYRMPEYVPDLSSEDLSDIQKELAAGVSQALDQTMGLSPGHTYEIGLGTHMSSVSEWREGSKAEVFSRSSLASNALAGTPLRMELINLATVRVIDEGCPQEKTGKEWESEYPK
ncbi:hypothetical protein LTR37_008904 [Vermiconidia calcicola]|uniref:Uncharacterized protein n=1 Tax=Vermiconidia calcicola TaxID=1690605 RepID=A0ACC3N9C5_9PEZI|nr:hypothetical protein LTR37_008904 [Vermiconidia calcicola]